MKASLLAAEENDIPTSLGDGSIEDDAVSEFSRLISIVHNDDDGVNPNHIFDFQSRRQRRINNSRPVRNLPPQTREETSCSPSFTIVVSGACSFLFVAFVCASFTSSSWTETVLSLELPQLPVDVQTNLLPIASTSLSSVIQLFLQADLGGISTLVWLTSLLVPCLFVVLAPSWIVQVYSTNKDYQNGTWVRLEVTKEESWLRNGLHLLIRWASTVVFVVLLMTSSCEHVKVEWSNSLVSVQSKMGNGIAAFTVGISFAIVAIGVLRLASSEDLVASPCEIRRDISVQSVAEAGSSITTDGIVSDRQVCPSLESLPEGTDEADGMMRILEDEPLLVADSGRDSDSPGDTRRHIGGIYHNSAGEARPTTFGQILCVFQVGLLSILFWVPSILLPILRFDYTGFASEFIPGHTASTISLYAVPLVLSNETQMAGSPPWVVWLMGSLIFGLTVLCPLLAIVLGISIWMVPSDATPPAVYCSRRSLQTWLYALHPAVGSIVLAVSVFIAAYGVEAWSNSIFNAAASQHYVCGPLERLVGESCLLIRGRPMVGAWFYMFHAVLLEGFILLTLQWS